MDYRTLLLTNVAFLTIYTVAACLLAYQNRKMTGFILIACGLLVGLLKVVFQGLEGLVPHAISSLLANQLYLFSFIFQMLGLRWFVDKNPVRLGWLATVVGCVVLFIRFFISTVFLILRT